MTIQEAIKVIINKNDNSILQNSQKFCDNLKILSPEYIKEIKIISIALDDNILAKIFSNEKDNVKIAKLKDEFESQGMSENWKDFIIKSFAFALNWNYTPQSTNPTPKNITYTEIALDDDVLKQLGYSKKQDIVTINIPPTYEYQGKYYKITSIGGWAFENCNSLINIEIPNTVTSIDTCAFTFCKSIKIIDIPKSVRHIGDSAFMSCSSLKMIEIPYGVTRIEDGTFDGCSSLKNVELPDGLRSIGNCAFYLCPIKSIYVPDSVTTIEDNAFRGAETVYYKGYASGSPWGAMQRKR